MAASFEWTIYQNRTAKRIVNLFESDGTTGVALAATDVVRFKMGRRIGSAPDLDLDTVAPTVNASGVDVVTNPAPAQVRVTLAQADLTSLVPGVYNAEVIVVDDSEPSPANAALVASIGVVNLIGSMAGDIGLT